MVFLAGCGSDEPAGRSPPQTVSLSDKVVAASTSPSLEPGRAGDTPVARGRAIYNFRCYFCHGYSGDAKTLAATYLVPPPRNFMAAQPRDLPLERIRQSVQEGRPGTAMRGFSGLLSPQDIDDVSTFISEVFVSKKEANTHYHTRENGWPDHEKRYAPAFPFARGEMGLSESTENMSPELLAGRKLYLQACVTCHDRGKPDPDPVVWESRPVSWPRFNYDHKNPEVDVKTSATPYHKHDIPRVIDDLSPVEKRGEKLFLDNCAFCHAADGTGKNWIGSFLEPHPRDLTASDFMRGMTRQRLEERIRHGLKGTSMPAWKDVLADEEIHAIVSYIHRAFHPLKEGKS